MEEEEKVYQPQVAHTETMQTMMMHQMMKQQNMVQNQMYQEMLQQRKRDSISEKSRFWYIVLALCFGTIGIHNLYAKRYGCGFIQFLLGIIVIGIVITVPWSILEILFVRKDGDGKKLK